MATRTRVSRGTRYSRGTGSRRKFVWARRLIIGATTGANAASFSDLLTDFQTALGADALGVTVVRIRGAISFTGTSLLVVGARIMTQSDFATLVSPAQGPSSDQYADWMMYEPVVHNGVATVGSVSGQHFDVKSSRKLEELGQGLLLAVSNPTLSAASWDMDLSIGLKLP